MVSAALLLALNSDAATIGARQDWFAFTSLRAAAQTAQNTVLSPASLLYSLSGLLPASTGESRRVLVGALGVPTEPTDQQYSDLKAIFAALTSGKSQLESAAAAWIDLAAHPDPSYIQSVKQKLGYDVFSVDLRESTTVATINKWASEMTHGKVPVVLPGLRPQTRLVLSSALYYKAPWSEHMTRVAAPLTFGKVGQTREVQALSVVANMARIETSGFRAVSVPLEGGNSAEFYVPTGDVTPEELAVYLASHPTPFPDEPTATSLTVPTFRAQFFGSAVDLLSRSGLKPVFEFRGEFPSISPDVCVQDAYHRTWIDLNQNGIEAASATVVSVGGLGGGHARPRNPTPFFVDRPFLFILRKGATRSALLAAIIYEPTRF